MPPASSSPPAHRHAAGGILLAVGYFGATLLLGGLLAVPAQALLATFTDTSIVRATSRALLLAAFLLAPLLLYACGLTAREAFGVRRPPGGVARELAAGFALGAATFLPLVALLVVLGVRAAQGDPAGWLLAAASALPAALATAVLVAAVEESLFRGVVFAAVRARSGPAVAVGLSSLLFAVAHFLRPDSAATAIGAAQWYGGFEVIAAGFARLAQFAALAGDFIALAAGGVALALIRERTAGIAAAVGAHAAWVVGIKLTREVTGRVPDSPLGSLAGDFDGVIGYLAGAWLALMLAAFALSLKGARRRR